MPWHMSGTSFGVYTTEKLRSCEKQWSSNTGISMRKGESQKNRKHKHTGDCRRQAVQFTLTLRGPSRGDACDSCETHG